MAASLYSQCAMSSPMIFIHFHDALHDRARAGAKMRKTHTPPPEHPHTPPWFEGFARPEKSRDRRKTCTLKRVFLKAALPARR